MLDGVERGVSALPQRRAGQFECVPRGAPAQRRRHSLSLSLCLSLSPSQSGPLCFTGERYNEEEQRKEGGPRAAACGTTDSFPVRKPEEAVRCSFTYTGLNHHNNSFLNALYIVKQRADNNTIM